MLSLQNLLCYQTLQSFTNIVTIACILNILTALWHLHRNSHKPTLNHVCSICYSACRKILVGGWNSHVNTLTSWVSCVYSCFSFIPRPWIPCSIPTCSLSMIEKKHHVTTFTFQILLCLNALQKDCYMCVCTTAQALAYSPAFLHCLLSITVSTLFKKLCVNSFFIYISMHGDTTHTYRTMWGIHLHGYQTHF